MLLQNCFRIARRLSPIAGGSPPLAARLSTLVAHRWWFAALARRSSLAAPRIGIPCDASVAHGRRPSLSIARRRSSSLAVDRRRSSSLVVARRRSSSVVVARRRQPSLVIARRRVVAVAIRVSHLRLKSRAFFARDT